MGSSIVTMCLELVRFTRSSIDASVVDVPLPVVPVTRIMARSSRASLPMTSGSPRSSNLGTPKGTKRVAIETDPRCLKALTLNRPTPATA